MIINSDFILTKISDKEEDISALVELMKDKEISDNTLTIPYPYREDHARNFILKTKDSVFDKVIRVKETNKLIGTIGIKINSVQDHKAGLGYWLAKEYWNKGLMTATVQKFTDFWFQEWKLDKITASCFENNLGSSKVLEKCGFKQEGFLPYHYKKNHKFFNGKLYGKVNPKYIEDIL